MTDRVKLIADLATRIVTASWTSKGHVATQTEEQAVNRAYWILHYAEKVEAEKKQ